MIFHRNLLKSNAGFSLIELMIVVVIIGVLVAIALPAYNGYVSRARMTEVINFGNEASQRAIFFHTTKGRFPSTKASDEVIDTKYVSNVQFYAPTPADQVVIHIYLTEDTYPGAGDTIPLLFQVDYIDTDGTFTIKCRPHTTASATIPAEYLPDSCQA